MRAPYLWSRHKRRERRWLVAALVALTVGGVTACSSSTASTGGQSSAVYKIKIGTSVVNSQLLPLWVAQANGYFAKHHLDVTIADLTASTESTALLSGSVQFIQINSGTFLQAKAQNTPLLAIDSWSFGQPVALIVAKSYAAAHGITAETPLATVMQKLVGSTGGLSSSNTEGQANILFGSYNIQPSQLHEVMFSTPTAAEAALDTGGVDWFVTGQPVPDELAAEGHGIVVADRQNAAAWGSLEDLNSIGATTKSYASAHAQETKDLVAALQEATTFIHNNPSKCVSVMQKYLPGISRSILLKTIAANVWPTDGRMTSAMWAATESFTVREGEIPSDVKLVEGQDWTNAYATTASS